MRQYYIISGILLILPIIDFAVAAPVLVQEKHQAGVDAVHIPKYSATALGKRFDELSKLWPELFHDAESDLPKLESSSTSGARPSSSSQPSGLADGGTDVKQLLPTISEAQSSVSSPDHASPSPGIRINGLWVELHSGSEADFAEPESSSAARLSSSSQLSGLADEGMDVKQSAPTIPEEQSPVSRPDHASPSPGDQTNDLWLKLFGHPESHFLPQQESSSSSVARPSSSSQLSGLTDEGMDVKEQPPSIPEGPSSESDYKMMDLSPSSLMSSTNPYSQWMGSDSPSSGKRKRP